MEQTYANRGDIVAQEWVGLKKKYTRKRKKGEAQRVKMGEKPSTVKFGQKCINQGNLKGLRGGGGGTSTVGVHKNCSSNPHPGAKGGCREVKKDEVGLKHKRRIGYQRKRENRIKDDTGLSNHCVEATWGTEKRNQKKLGTRWKVFWGGRKGNVFRGGKSKENRKADQGRVLGTAVKTTTIPHITKPNTQKKETD